MNRNEFSDLIKIERIKECTFCNKANYIGWKAKSELEPNFQNLGLFDERKENIKNNGYNQFHIDGTSYWSKDAPIALNYYPYHECEVVVCKECHSVFLYYSEIAGHYPESRLRWVQPDLVVYNA